MMLPSFRTALAVERCVEKNILIRTWGGLGDQICAEPTLRFALDTFKGCKVFLASEAPYLFQHLKFERVFDLKKEQPIYQDYLLFNTINPTTDLSWEFYSHMLVNCVDYPSLCAFRCQMPIKYKELILHPSDEDKLKAWEMVKNIDDDKKIIVHPGKHWQSKTFPKEWWDAVLAYLINNDKTPVIIGANTDDNRSTVDINITGCMDLRNALTVMQSVALLQMVGVSVLITNDSAPLHMAASGNVHIGYFATCKHPDYIAHWRHNEFGWGMQNLSLGGIWDVLDYCPNKKCSVEAENVGDELLKSWLPDPKSVAEWALNPSYS